MVAGTAEVDTVSPANYAGESGYDLYIFDCFNPQEMPKDGAVWLFNLDSNLPLSGFSVYGSIETKEGVELKLSTSTASLVKTLTQDLKDTSIQVKTYQKYGALQQSSGFQTLYTYNKSPMIFIGKNGYGNREVVFAFDLHQSNFPLTYDYTVLIRNILNYSFPKVFEKYTYDCGETLAVNAAPDCESIQVVSPSGERELKTLNTIDNYRLTEVGVYTIVMNTKSGVKEYNVFAQLPETERAPLQTENEFRINGETTDGSIDGKYDKLIWVFVLLSVMFIADWVVYCYDKYQLR